MFSQNTLHLEPLGAAGSKRGSRATVRPLYRKDAFYTGSVSHLMQSEQRGHHHHHHLHHHHHGLLHHGGQHHHHHPPHSTAQHSRRISNNPSFATLDEYRHSIMSIPKIFSRR